ncbi:hypothetical protein Tco_0110490 [Tanacetum coccineum]
MASMPSANPMLVDLNEMENVFKKLFDLLEKNFKRESIFYTSKEELRLIDNRFNRDVKEMKDVFVSVENDLDETFKQNEFLKGKGLHDETERISKASKDVSNESKTADTGCNDAIEVTRELSKRIVELEKDLSKFEAKSIAFEIALQHKSRENSSLKTLEKENENFMASLQIENAHLKQTYKDFKIEFFKKKQLDISELHKESGVEHNLFENETSIFQIKIDELEKSLAKQIKEKSELLIKIDNLENVFADKEKRATLGKLNAFDNENCDFESKVDDSKAEKDRFLKEINHLRTQLENLKGKRVETKFDNSSILGKPPLLNNEKDQLLKLIASLES